MKVEVEAEELLKLRENIFCASSNTKQDFKSSKINKAKNSVPSASVLLTSENKSSECRSNCTFCNKSSHASHDCFSLIDMSVDERHELVKKKGACLRCLRKGSLVQKCKAQVKCHICYSLLQNTN